jgi:DNA-binding response OmpR family regulator
MPAAGREEVLRAGGLEVRPQERIALADGRALTLSVREFGLLVELARHRDRIITRDQLYRAVWGAALRQGDRSVDVYVHKLRSKLEQALPGWSFVHTHVGFGYRFAPESSHFFHNGATAR